MRSLIVVCVFIGAVAAAQAQGACIKPDTPSCAVERGPFPTALAYDDCRKEMIIFKKDMEGYASCLEESGWPPDALLASNELEAMLAQFNRRARGESN